MRNVVTNGGLVRFFIDEGTEGLSIGDLVTVEVDEAGEYDLWGALR